MQAYRFDCEFRAWPKLVVAFDININLLRQLGVTSTLELGPLPGTIQYDGRRSGQGMAAFTAEQRIVINGAVRIQVEDGRGLPGQSKICQLKTIGWYLAEIMMPQ